MLNVRINCIHTCGRMLRARHKRMKRHKWVNLGRAKRRRGKWREQGFHHGRYLAEKMRKYGQKLLQKYQLLLGHVFAQEQKVIDRSVLSQKLSGHVALCLYFVNIWLIFPSSFLPTVCVMVCTPQINNQQHNYHHNSSLIHKLGARSHLPYEPNITSDSCSNSYFCRLLYVCLYVWGWFFGRAGQTTPSWTLDYDNQRGHWKQWLRTN